MMMCFFMVIPLNIHNSHFLLPILILLNRPKPRKEKSILMHHRLKVTQLEINNHQAQKRKGLDQNYL